MARSSISILHLVNPWDQKKTYKTNITVPITDTGSRAKKAVAMIQSHLREFGKLTQ
jgi:hypothetical protein